MCLSSPTFPLPLRETYRMRDLDPIHIDQLLCIKGMVIRCSPVIPDLKQAYFRCYLCSAVLEVTIDR
jgi:DNA replication licensing factor MCM4